MSQDSTISKLPAASTLTGSEIVPIDQGATKQTTASQIAALSNASIAAETAARIAADNVEAATRATNDTTLQTNITAEASARTTADALIVSNLAASSGSSLIGWIYALGSAVAATVQNWISWQPTSAFGFMTVAQIADIQANTCTLDVTVPLQNFFNVGGLLQLNKGTYKQTAKLTVPGGCTVFGAGPLQSSIKKFFNGDQFDWGDLTSFRDMTWDGNGGSFTGSNATISSGSSQNMYHCTFTDAASNPIKWTAANVGVLFSFVSSQISSHTLTNAACIFNSGDTSTNTKGELLNIDCNGGVLFDTSTGAVGGLKAIGCTTTGLIFNQNNVNVEVIGCRLATNDVHIKGTNVSVLGCANAGNLFLDLGAVGCTVGPNMFAAGKGTIDNSGQVNVLYTEPVSFPPVWGSSGTQPAIGNGTNNGVLTRNGSLMTHQFTITMGSTTTFGTGTYTFSNPYGNANTVVMDGKATIFDFSANQYFEASALILPGSATIQIVYSNLGAISATVPMTFAVSDQIIVSITGSVV